MMHRSGTMKLSPTWLCPEMQKEYEKQLEQLKNTVHKLRSQQEDYIDEGNHAEDAMGTRGCWKLKKENSSPTNGLLLMSIGRSHKNHYSKRVV
jgi:hypothetical protein